MLAVFVAALFVSCSSGPKPCVDDLGCVAGEICVSGRCSPGERDAGLGDAGSSDAGAQDGGTSDAGQDEAGTTDAGPDVTPPQVISTTPMNMVVDVPAYTPFAFTIQFSEPMDTMSVQATISQNDTSFEVNSIIWSANDTQLTLGSDFGPTSWSTTYSISLSGTDLVGNTLPTFTFTFTSEVQGAAIVSWTPGDSVPAAPTDRLSFTFSSAMNTSSVHVEVLDINANALFDAGIATWSNNDQTVSYLAPSMDWSPSGLYAVSVDGKDTDGGHSFGSFSFSVQP